jgi:hypothetical protein
MQVKMPVGCFLMQKLTVPEYAKKVQLDQSTVYRQIKAGKLKSELIDGTLHVVVEPPKDAKDNDAGCDAFHDAFYTLARLQDEVAFLRKELEVKNEQLQSLQVELVSARQSHDAIIQQIQQDAEAAKQRSDTIILQLTLKFEEQTKLLEDMRQSRASGLWARVKTAFGFAAS